MPTVAELVSASIAAWNGDLEAVLFGATAGPEVAASIEQFCADHLSPVAEGIFYRSGVGSVVGVRLNDGRQVVIKVHRWNVSIDRLTDVQRVQEHLADRSVPAPRPIGRPQPLGEGIATVEELRPAMAVDGAARSTLRSIALGLYEFVRAAADLVGLVDVGRPLLLRPAGAALWPEPHSVRFDFGATAAGAEWIDELAEAARARLDVTGFPTVIGHFDWRVENLGFDDRGRLVAIYDWDSLGEAPEPVVVGATAAAFCTDWGAGSADPLPGLDDMRGFVADYERARGRPFSPVERSLLDAANLFAVAYGARCQHSDRTLHPDLAGHPDEGWARLLHERGAEGLSR